MREDASQRKRETAGAFARGDGTAGAGEVEEAAARTGVKATLDRLVAATKASDAAAVMDSFDTERMVAELERQDLLTNIDDRMLKGLAKGLRQGMQGNVLRGGLFNWERYEVRRVKVLGGGEVLAYVSGVDANGISVKRRIWLRLGRAVVGGSRGWKVYDHEDLDTGMRFTTLMGVAMGSALGGGGNPAQATALAQAANVIRDATNDLLADNIDAAHTKLATIEQTPLPPMLDALRLFTKANACVRSGQNDDAMALLARARQLHADMVAVDLLEAMALNGLGRHAEALVPIDRYLELLGDDGLSRSTRGDALAGLRRLDEARRCYRIGLDADPESADCLVGLATLASDAGTTVPATAPAATAAADTDAVAELTSRLRASRSATKLFFIAANYCLKQERAAPLATLVTAYRPIAGGDFWADYFGGEARILAKEFPAAVDPLRASLTAAPAEHRALVLGELHAAYQLSGQHLRGYKESEAGDRDAAFRSLAKSLAVGSDEPAKTKALGRTLLELVTLRRASVPDDPWTYYFEGEAHSLLEQFPQSLKAYGEAVRLAPPLAAAKGDGDDAEASQEEPPISQFQRARTGAAYAAGTPLEAYDEAVFAHRTFATLARWHAADDDAKRLAALIARHRSAFPQDPNLVLWDGELAFSRAQYPECIERMTAARKKVPTDSLDRWRVEDRAVRSFLRTGRAADASQFLGSNEAKRWYAAMILARSPFRATDAAVLMDKLIADDDATADEFYGDPDFAEAIKGPDFADWRKRHPPAPPPATGPSPTTP